MPTERSIEAVDELKSVFSASSLVLTAEYRGLTVAQLNGLRRALRQGECQFQVAKNTLARIAADEVGRPQLREIIDGPIGFVTAAGDPAAAAKTFVRYVEDNRLELKLIGGVLDTQVLSAERVQALAALPPKEELLAKLLGGMNGPITGLVTVLSGPVRALATVLQRHVENQQKAAAPAAS